MKKKIKKSQSKKFLGSASKKLLILGLLFIVVAGILYAAPKIQKRLTAPSKYIPAPSTTYVTPTQNTSDLFIPGPKALLKGTKWVPQSFNNCGPATTSMVLGYFGHTVAQTVTKAALRTNEDDKNVFTYEMQDYLQKEYGISSKLMYNGDREVLKKLIANGFYVVVEDWLHPNEDIGHVTILRGYDDEKGVFIADDSYLGTDITYKYDQFEETQWKAFNREYLPVYLPDQEEKVKKIIDQSWDSKTMFEGAVKKAEEEIAKNDRDMYAYFNLGTSYYGLGEYEKAYEAFKKSQAIGWPKRMLWYQIQPVQTLNELGKYQEALAMADLGLWSNESFSELHVEKARAYKGLGDLSKARDEIQKALQYAPNLQSAKDLSASF